MAKAKVDVRVFGPGVYGYKDFKKEMFKKEMFMVNETLSLLQEMNHPDILLVVITNFVGTQEQKKPLFEEVLSWFKDKKNVVILTLACATTFEFPESEYYDSSFHELSEYVKEAIKAGKKPIPYDEVITRESEFLESIGFIDFNNFVGYEFSKAYLYGNELGTEIFEYVKKFQENK